MAARTAVVAGTATAVSGGVMHHQQRKAEQQYEAQQAAVQQQQYGVRGGEGEAAGLSGGTLQVTMTGDAHD